MSHTKYGTGWKIKYAVDEDYREWKEMQIRESALHKEGQVDQKD